MKERQQWFGKNICDVCGGEIKNVLYDAKRTDKADEWATMCQKCYQRHGAEIRWGSGQKYEEEDGVFYLTAGGAPDEKEMEARTFPDQSSLDMFLRIMFANIEAEEKKSK